MSGSKPLFKLFTFFGVLALVGVLLFGLFQQAGGIEGTLEGPAEAEGVTTYYATFEIDAGERIPIENVRAVIEEETNDQANKEAPRYVSDVWCPMQVNAGCEGAELNLLAGTPDVITRIESVGAFSTGLEATADGYEIPTDHELPESQYFTRGDRTATTTGYGYDTHSPLFDAEGSGYGYGYNIGTQEEVEFGEGYGYGYDNGKVNLIFEIDVVGDRLDTGEIHYLTVIAETESEIIGETETSSSGQVDVSLVLDESGSMGGQPIDAAKVNATNLVDRLGGSDQSGLVSFDSSAVLRQSLTFNHEDTKSAIEALTSGGGTDIDDGITASHQDFLNNGREDAKHMMILLSDGVSDKSRAVNAADLAKGDDIEIFSIAFGSGADEEVLENVSSEPKDEHFFVAGDDDLDIAFDQIVETIVTFKTQENEFSTPYIQFTPQASSGGGGGGGGNPPTGQTINAENNERFDGQQGSQVTVTEGLPEGTDSVTVTMSDQCTGCSVQVTMSDSPPSGTAGAPEGANILSYLSADVVGPDGEPVEGIVADATIEFEQPEGTDENEVVLLHDTGDWEYTDTSCSGGTCTSNVGSFSVFAIAVHQSPPTISDESPTGTIEQVRPVIEASFFDDRGIDTGSIELTLNGEERDETTGELDVTEDGFTYVHNDDLPPGENTVEVSIESLSGHATSSDWTFDVQPTVCPEGPSILQVTPSDGASDVDVNETIEATLEEGTCVIETVTVLVNGDEVDATYDDGVVRAELPESVPEGTTVDIEVTVQDTAENTATRSWTYDLQGDPPATAGPGGAPELSAWAWMTIGLVAIGAVAGLWWYQRQEP